jgi:hypothetical protein
VFGVLWQQWALPDPKVALIRQYGTRPGFFGSQAFIATLLFDPSMSALPIILKYFDNASRSSRFSGIIWVSVGTGVELSLCITVLDCWCGKARHCVCQARLSWTLGKMML